jgi:hypothetical protein
LKRQTPLPNIWQTCSNPTPQKIPL